jgi:hypothetical protein
LQREISSIHAGTREEGCRGEADDFPVEMISVSAFLKPTRRINESLNDPTITTLRRFEE